MLFVLLLLRCVPMREERRARGAAAGSAREEVVTKSRQIRMRNRCSFFSYVIYAVREGRTYRTYRRR
jgi:hypothetical protein